MIYGTVGIRQYSESGKVGAALSWADCLHGAGAAVFMQKSELDHDGGREVRGFLATLRTGSLLSSMLVLALLLRPVLAKRHPEATDDERERMTKIIAEYGRDPMDNFALLPDKRCFFTKDGKGLVTYALWRKYAVALADPICPPEGRAAAVAEFRAFCRNQDWQPIFYCVHVSNRPLYEEEDFVTFKVGEDARLDVAEFKLEGGKFQNLRTARNKARKGGLTFQWYDGTPHTDHGLEAQLTLISQEWLAHKHGGEMTFDLGAFSIDSIRKHGVAIVRNPEGRIETFATWLPYHQARDAAWISCAGARRRGMCWTSSLWRPSTISRRKESRRSASGMPHSRTSMPVTGRPWSVARNAPCSFSSTTLTSSTATKACSTSRRSTSQNGRAATSPIRRA
nr:phosphatidylglycerol lysyltransferase domain-containing protein [Verrucomicrobium spinosum]